MPTIELLSPAGVVGAHAVPLATRVPTLQGRVIGLLDNSKSGTRPFLDRVEELLRERAHPKDVVRKKKPTFARPAPEDLRQEILKNSDAVIEALAD